MRVPGAQTTINRHLQGAQEGRDAGREEGGGFRETAWGYRPPVFSQGIQEGPHRASRWRISWVETEDTATRVRKSLLNF